MNNVYRKIQGRTTLSACLSGFTGLPLHAATPQPLLRRPTFSVLPEKVGKKRRWMRIGLYRKPQNKPLEECCGQHTKRFLQSYTTAPPAWGQRSHRKQLPRKKIVKHAAVECRTHLRLRRWCEFLMERADRVVRPNMISDTSVGADAYIGPSSIPEMSRTEIDAVCP